MHATETLETTVSESTAPPVGPVRRYTGTALALTAFLVILFASFVTLTGVQRRLAAVLAAVVILWVTEAIPLALTGLLGIVACALLQVAPANALFAPFAEPLIILLIASFMMVRALFLHGLDRRLASNVLALPWVGARPARVLFMFGAITCIISSVVSNTATTAMMYAIALSLIATMRSAAKESAPPAAFATVLLLMASYAASIGGLATPVGTPPNLMGLAFIQRFLQYDFTFMRWVLLAAPLVLLLYLYLFAVLNHGSHSAKAQVPHPTPDRSALSRAQRSTAFAWVVTLILWVTPGLVAITLGDKHPAAVWMLKLFPESIAALIGVALLLSLPGTRGQRALPFRDAFVIDWEVILLYASGFALGVAASQTGLANTLGQSLASQVPPVSPYIFLLGTTFAAAIVSEFASNTSSANIVVPVVISVAQSAGYDPLPPAIAATFGSTLGFMLPISTPCNAIVYASGYIPLIKMVRYGLALDLVGAVVIGTGVYFLFPYLR